MGQPPEADNDQQGLEQTQVVGQRRYRVLIAAACGVDPASAGIQTRPPGSFQAR